MDLIDGCRFRTEFETTVPVVLILVGKGRRRGIFDDGKKVFEEGAVVWV